MAAQHGQCLSRDVAITLNDRTFSSRGGACLWLRDDGADYAFSPGLFDDPARLPVIRDVLADSAHRLASFAGDHPEVTRAEYESHQLHVEADR